MSSSVDYIKANLQSVIGELLKNRQVLLGIQSTPYASSELMLEQTILENEISNVQESGANVASGSYSAGDLVALTAELGTMAYHNQRVRDLAKKAGVQVGTPLETYIIYGGVGLAILLIFLTIRR